MLSIGFAGTAKNTGKTTTALHVLALAREAGLRLALTSIGYDGENKDNITGLPKPRYLLEKGACLATAQGCLKMGTARCCIHTVTGIQTILGRVVIAEVEAPGYVVLAGPNRKSDLRTVLEIFARIGVEFTLVDGALNRLVPLTAADGLVLSTGAALDERIPVVAAHARALLSLFQPPAVHPRAEPSSPEGPLSICLRQAGGREIHLETGSLLSEQTLEILTAGFDRQIAALTIPGACNPSLLQRLLERGNAHLDGADLIFGSPLKLAASGDPQAWSLLFQEADKHGQRVVYQESVPPRLLTVNPFYPSYLQRYETYGPSTVDKIALLAAVRQQVTQVPVVDIRQPHSTSILSLLGTSRQEPLQDRGGPDEP